LAKKKQLKWQFKPEPDISKLDQLYETLKNSINSKETSEKQINKSVERISKIKNKYCF
jgi:hypothetical protein